MLKASFLVSSNNESVTGEIFVENEADRNESSMVSAFTGVVRMSVAKLKAVIATVEKDTFILQTLGVTW